MYLREMNEAINDAEATLTRADSVATELAKLLIGRLRHVKAGWRNELLADLKKELRDFNAVTGVWK